MNSMKMIAVVLMLFITAETSAAEPNTQQPEGSSPDGITGKDLAGKRVVFLGDSITQAGGYISFIDYYLEKLYPEQNFDVYGLGLASETLSGLSEDNHAGGAFPRPCLFERLGRLLERAKPEVVFACYGINDGIYQPLDPDRFSAFQNGVKKLIEQCQAAGVEQIFLVTPPIYDTITRPGEFNYDSVMTRYAAWEMSLDEPAVHVIDLHSAMRKARDARTEVFSKDRVHPGGEGHLFMAQAILAGLNVPVPKESLATIQADPLYQQIDKLRKYRSANWMKHIGYSREKTVPSQPLGDTEEVAAKMKATINQMRRKE
ncbi:GDSL-like Lipase/Acylhydrolase [Bremerella volcania]|uniref:GDSL-like Lipase/Acylhydrolase n=1 Tax=Bremerella volcania TaxID=2527984 RepID=A0A518C377_9BACT|nr:SGNH/GDSL hydrolase family protein [Bremerella volcania]QDU73678.1 GDSL-like Lipase/Acylhydrolase [Bremerella volcania]